MVNASVVDWPVAVVVVVAVAAATVVSGLTVAVV